MVDKVDLLVRPDVLGKNGVNVNDGITSKTNSYLKRVFILGAGCSTEDGVPLIKNFFIELKRHQEKLDLKNDIFSFREKYRLEDSNIEEFLSYIDLHISLNSKILKDPNKLSEGFFDLKKMRNDLVNLIGSTVENLTKKGSTGDLSKIYHSFFKKLTMNDTIISFNWDTLLDTIFYDFNLRKYGLNSVIDYGDNFDMISIHDNKLVNSIKRVGIQLLKLHGSLNWFYCPSCLKKFFTFRQKLYSSEGKEGVILCPDSDCKKELDHLIVPPTFQKNFDREGFSPLIPIWRRAFEVLQDCDQVIIAGYSFPQDDVHFKHFLRSSLTTRNVVKSSNPLPIEVVNYKKYLNEKSEFENHYRSIFEGISLKIDPKFNYSKFSDFVGLL